MPVADASFPIEAYWIFRGGNGRYQCPIGIAHRHAAAGSSAIFARDLKMLLPRKPASYHNFTVAYLFSEWPFGEYRRNCHRLATSRMFTFWNAN
jgi:hypothetical protein